MIYFPEDNILTADGDFTPFKGYGAGRPIAVELSGVFGGATATLGFTSSDATPVFIVDVGDDGLARPKTEAGRWISVRPASGKPAIRVSGATGTTALLVKIVDLLPR